MFSTSTKNRLFKLFCIACAFLISRLEADTLGARAYDEEASDQHEAAGLSVKAADQDDDEDLDYDLAQSTLSYDEDPDLEGLSDVIDDNSAFDAYVASILAAYKLEDGDEDLGPSGLMGSLEDDDALGGQASFTASAENGEDHAMAAHESLNLQHWSSYLPEELMVFGDASPEAPSGAQEGLAVVDAAPKAEDPFAAEPSQPNSVEPNAVEVAPAAAVAAAPVAAGAAEDLFATEKGSGATGEPETIFQKEASAGVTKGDQDTISVDFADTTARAILRNVADIFGLNLAIPDGVVGNISLKLANVTWRQVFDLVLEPIGYVRVEDGNIVKIKSRDEVMTEPVDTRVFIIDHGSAEELKESIASLVDENVGGDVQVEKRANALIVSERPSRLNRIYAIIKELDKPEPQVMIESKFVRTTNTNALKLGFSYSDSLTSGVKDPQRAVERKNNYVRNNKAQVALDNDDTERKTLFTDTAIFSLPAFQATLNMLQTDNKTRIINNPTVVTLNNKPALISVGTRTPVPNYTYSEERGTYEVTGFTYLDTGTILNVEPHVNTAGFITMTIKPEVSKKGESIKFSTNAEIPEIESVRTESVVTLKDGFTVAIGGLIQNEGQKQSRRVPLLGHIPVLGDLFFRGRDNKLFSDSILIFITARTLNPDGTSYEEVVDPRTLFDMDIQKTELPGYTLPEKTLQRMRAIADQEQAMIDERMASELDRKQASLDGDYKAYVKNSKKLDELNRKGNLYRRRSQREEKSAL